MADVTTFLSWHTGVAARIYLGTLDIANTPLEVSLHGSGYVPDVDHTLQSDLSGEIAGTRQPLAHVTYNDTSSAGVVEGVIDVDDSIWAAMAGTARTAVWSVVATGEVIAHAGVIDSTTALTDLSLAAGGKIEWGPLAVNPGTGPVGGWGATSAREALGWSPARGYNSTSVATDLTTWESYIAPARALVTFAHDGQGGTYAAQRTAIDKVTNPNLATEQRKGHSLSHQLTLVMIRKGVGETLADLAAGAYDAHWRAVGKLLHDNGCDAARYSSGQPRTICRIGWEANGDWYAWWLGNDIANYKKGYDRITLLMEAGTTGSINTTTMTVGVGTASSGVAGAAPNGITYANMDFEFCVNTKGRGTRADVVAACPSRATIFGMDAYDYQKANCDPAHQSPAHNSPNGAPVYSGHLTAKSSMWDRNWLKGNAGLADTTKDTIVGLYWGLSLAQELGLYFAVSEWGILTGSDEVGDDNWHFIRDMHAFLEVAAATGRLAYHTYSDYRITTTNEEGRIRSGSFPLAEAKFRELFG